MEHTLTTTQAGALLGLKKRAVIKHINVGHLPATRFGKAFVLKASDVIEFAQKRAEGKHVPGWHIKRCDQLT